MSLSIRPISKRAAAVVLSAGFALPLFAGDTPEFPPFADTIEGLEKVVSTADGSSPLYDLYADKKTAKLLAVLPSGFATQMLLIAPTVSGGDPEAGVMGSTIYAKWRRIGKMLALVAPDLSVRTTGDQQAKDSVDSLYTGTIIVSAPIISMAPGGRPVLDFGSLVLNNVGKFFAANPGYGPSTSRLDASLATLVKTKAFPKNILVEYEAPGVTGQLQRVTFSLGKLEGTPGFKPRKADPRVGYFYDWYRDYAEPNNEDITDRYITRWCLEKADPKMKVSPAKSPITWYIEHTTPIRYRRYVKEGIQMWNQAFGGIGIDGALLVLQQDSSTGAHMDLDPEDARYNFFRWNTSDQGYAIGPSRTNPMTGEILDADVVWNQGLTRAVSSMLSSLTDDLTAQGFDAEALAWFHENPDWDPRVRVASPERQAQLKQQRALDAIKVVTESLESQLHPWTEGSNDPTNAACKLGNQLSMDVSLAAAAFSMGMLDLDDSDEEIPLLDGVPEEFLGAMIKYISAHEVGHCLGLQHNMAASTIRTLAEINSEGFEGATIGSVMDYAAANINHELGDVQGPYATPMLGPYDHWAIAFGYGAEKDLEKVLSQVNDPDHIYVTQIAMSVGSDPRNMTWDLGANNLNFSESRLGLVAELRSNLVEKIAQDGEPWAMVRKRYQQLLGTHMSSLFSAAKWIGGAYENSDFKGDPGDRAPVGDVSADKQRRAMNLIIDHSFNDDAFGLTPELIRHMGKRYWWDPKGMSELMEDPSFTVHDQVGTFHAIGLSLLLNPTTLRRVYDNEFRTADADDSMTLAEVVRTVTDSAWSEFEKGKKKKDDSDSSVCSSFRRNLQQEHVNRLSTLALINSGSASMRTIRTLAAHELRRIAKMADKAISKLKLDAYTEAHLTDVSARISKTLEAAYVTTK
ncbi:MAG: hypothetical protein ACI8TQ_001471 [Planctomycetota bacterium]|jgi:hypothetical protein